MSVKGLKIITNVYVATVCQFGVAVILLWLTRFAFAWYNFASVGCPSFGNLLRLSFEGLRYDLSAAAYFNVLFIAMRIVPFAPVRNKIYSRITDGIYYVTNGLLLAINVGDIPYYAFTGSRLRWSNILTITTDSGLGGIVGSYIGQYWWAFVSVVLVVALLVWLYKRFAISASSPRTKLWIQVCLFVVLGFLTFLCMRGRTGGGVPLAIADAAFVVKSAPEINIVLNSPFCILRSLNLHKDNALQRMTFYSDDELASIRTSVHRPEGHGSATRRNLMMIIIESGGAEWIDALSVTGTERGLMPFVDSLARRSKIVRHTMAGTRVSIGGTTALTMGFPAFEPFYYMLSPYNKNIVDSPARLLADRGYETVFYYGCKHGSFNIDQTAYASGYSRIVDREAYGNDADFDGGFGIFDYPMAAYVANDLDKVKEPFYAAWFTVSAHGPFILPEGWDTSGYIHQEASPERGLEYTDQSIRHFFELASTQPWFGNTTFIITADHGNRDFKGTDYDGDFIRNHIPFVIYTPGGSIEPSVLADRFVSQHDIPATLLTLLGYESPFVSLGTDALVADYAGYGLTRTDGGRFFISGPRYSIYADPALDAVDEVFDTAADPYMRSTVAEPDSAEVDAMLRFARAFMQDYTERLNDDRLTLSHN